MFKRVEDRILHPLFLSSDPGLFSLNICGKSEQRFILNGHTSAASTPPGKGVSQGEEAVLADSGWAGEITAGVERVRRGIFSVFC